ncbi:MAG: MerR family transcriptional regulator [Dehalococcoidia bacterium]|nr:MerR family transcriptional regulator [Dehalococcoidia bacterium]
MTSSEQAERTDAEARYQIGEVAERTGVTQRTLRFYEEKGLLKPPERMDGGFRLYSDADITTIEFIKRLQDLLGFTLSEIKEMVEAEDLRQQILATFRPDRDLAARKKRIEQIISTLERQLGVVDHKVEQLTVMQAELTERLTYVRSRREEIIQAMETGEPVPERTRPGRT